MALAILVIDGPSLETAKPVMAIRDPDLVELIAEIVWERLCARKPPGPQRAGKVLILGKDGDGTSTG